MKPEEQLSPEFLTTLCRGNTGAMEFIRQAHEWFHGIDDVMDREGGVLEADSARRREQVAQAFAEGIVLLSHPFYLQNLAALRMTLLSVSQLYSLAAAFELSGDQWRRQWAEVQRHAGGQLMCAVAMICGGWQHGQQMLKLMAEETIKREHE